LVIEHYMAEPRRRVLSQGHNLRTVIDDAMKVDPYSVTNAAPSLQPLPQTEGQSTVPICPSCGGVFHHYHICPSSPPKAERKEILFTEMKLLKDALSWSLDLLDMYDKRLVELNEPKESVYSPVHVEGKRRARQALAATLSVGLPTITEKQAYAAWGMTPPQTEGREVWQDIATAPRDGVEILLSCPHGTYVSWWAEHDIEWWHVTDNKFGPYPLRGSSPTHWMPLPPAPVSEKGPVDSPEGVRPRIQK
jgi:hypothetical protein